MDKFFTINQDSQYYKDWIQYEEDVKNNAKLFNEFSEQQGIEAKNFVPSKKYLVIVPTKNDITKFEKELTKGNGETRQFRRNSKTAKAWMEATRDIRIADRPNYFCYGLRICGRYMSRCFKIGSVLYGSLSCDECKVELLDFMKEIKASEFYRVIEEHSESLGS